MTYNKTIVKNINDSDNSIKQETKQYKINIKYSIIGTQKSIIENDITINTSHK